MPFALSNSMVNNLVNTIYKANGKDPYSYSTRNTIQTTTGVDNLFGTRNVSAETLKNTLNDSWSNVALTLKDQYHPDRAQELAQIVTDGLDRADGSGNGWVRLQNSNDYADLLDAWTGQKRDGYISDRALQWGLENGYLVVGEGGKLLSTSDAKYDGDTILTIHEDSRGPKLALETNASAPYNSNPYSPYDPYNNDPYNNDPYNSNPYSPYDPYSNDPYNSNPYSPYDPYSPAPYDPYSNPGDYATKRSHHSSTRHSSGGTATKHRYY